MNLMHCTTNTLIHSGPLKALAPVFQSLLILSFSSLDVIFRFLSPDPILTVQFSVTKQTISRRVDGTLQG